MASRHVRRGGVTHTHTYNEEIIAEATCSQEGVTKYTCTDCGASFTSSSSLPELTASEVCEKAKKFVGEILTCDKKGNGVALGTGFVYSADGKIITNYHVIEDAYSATITINEVKYPIQSVLAYDKNIDLAVLKINASGLTVPDICKEIHAVGKAVYALGSAQGLTDTFSQGIITYADRELNGVHYVQHNAAISSGNSGSPLLNKYGEVIGINTMALRDSQNLNFAISVRELGNLKYGTPLTVAQFYEKECNVFTKLKNYAKASGSYDSDGKYYNVLLASGYASGMLLTRNIVYNIEDDSLSLLISAITSDTIAYLYIEIDEIDGAYGYLFNFNDYKMVGTLYASTFTSNTLLGYSYVNTSYSSIIKALRESASTMAEILISHVDDDFAEIGVTAVDLGFVNF